MPVVDLHYPLIGITGRIGSGKTTAAMYMCERYGFARHRFASPLKAMLHCLGLTPLHTDGELREKPCKILGGMTPRYAMQTLGTEWGRDLVSKTLWVDAWKATMPQNIPVVVDDVRFANEAEAVYEMGGTVIRIDRPEGATYDVHMVGKHASEDLEFSVFEYNRVINDGTIYDLECIIGEIALAKLSGVA